MATLKSIKNKYLTNSDGDVLGVTTNTENISALSFKLATADSLSKFNLVDGFADDYQDALGVNVGTSSAAYRDDTSNYYVGDSSPSGGTVTTWSTYTVHSFLSSGTFTLSNSQEMVDCLVIGGGGGGGAVFVTPGGGGGGAGGWVYNSTYTVAAGAHVITIGEGGLGSTDADTKGLNGADTTVGSLLTAKGGGGGGQYGGAGPDNKPGSDGGSGGGGSWTPGDGGSETQTGQPGDSGAPAGFGNDGGDGKNEPAGKGGAGGGGAGAAGQDMQSGGGAGVGGVGKSTTMVDNTTRYFGGGGGGGEGDTGSYGAAGGNGGGGPGGTESGGAYNGVAGTVNSGGGGGGGGTNSSGQDGYGGNGGSGVVYFRYTTAGSGGAADMTLISNTYTAQAAPTTARIIMDEYTSTGSTTINTDIKAYASRDGGTTYTQITSLADQGTIETNHRLLSGSVDISGQPSGTSVTYKIETFNQGGSKETRVYGTSMAWA